MRIKSFLYLLLFYVFMTFPASAQQISADQAKKWAQYKGEEIIQILTSSDSEAKYNKLDKILQNDVDADYIGKFSAGKYWRLMTDEQQKKYIPLFRRYLSSMYKSFPLDIEKGDIEFEVNKSVASENHTDVFCIVTIKNLLDSSQSEQDLKVNAIFMLVKDNNMIKVRDIKINESSLLLKLRDSIGKLIKEDDEEIAWFLEDFETIISDNENKYD